MHVGARLVLLQVDALHVRGLIAGPLRAHERFPPRCADHRELTVHRSVTLRVARLLLDVFVFARGVHVCLLLIWVRDRRGLPRRVRIPRALRLLVAIIAVFYLRAREISRHLLVLLLLLIWKLLPLVRSLLLLRRIILLHRVLTHVRSLGALLGGLR